jgi:hypothetical protein
LGEGSISANPNHFGVLGLERGIIVRTGRLQIFDSSWTKIEHVKVDQNVFPFQAAQFEFSALATV